MATTAAATWAAARARRWPLPRSGTRTRRVEAELLRSTRTSRSPPWTRLVSKRREGAPGPRRARRRTRARRRPGDKKQPKKTPRATRTTRAGTRKHAPRSVHGGWWWERGESGDGSGGMILDRDMPMDIRIISRHMGKRRAVKGGTADHGTLVAQYSVSVAHQCDTTGTVCQ